MHYFVNTKIAEDALPLSVLELLGLPDGGRLLRGGAVAFSWSIDEDADGLGIARSGTRDNLEGQVQQLSNLTAKGRNLRTLIVAPSMCGNRRFHERPDLLEADDAIQAGWCRFVAFTTLDRISREADAQTLFMEHLRESKVELILAASSPVAVDFESLSLEAQLLGMTPRHEREQMRTTLHRIRRQTN